MRFNVCVLMVLLGVALARAGPTPKVAEKKSLEEPKLETNKQDLNIAETGEDKDRAKKSAASFCVEIKPGSSQPIQVPCKNDQTTAQNTLLSIQSEPATQFQTLNLAQPSFIQTVPQTSVVLPQQQVLQPLQTFQIIQPASQPCSQPSPSVNIAEPVLQSNVVQHTSQPNSNLNPYSYIKTTTEQPKPARIEQPPQPQPPQPLPVPQESLSMLPVATSYQEPVFTLPSSSMVMYPKSEPSEIANIIEIPSVPACSNPLHSILTPCTCQNNMAILSESSMEPMAIKVLSAIPYSSPYARSSSPLVMPYNAQMLSHILSHDQMDKARHHKSHTHTNINVNAELPYIHYFPQNNFQTTYQKPVPLGVETLSINNYPNANVLLDKIREAPGITVNTYPQVLRAASPMVGFRTLRNKETVENSPLASETKDLMQTNKTPREINSSQLLPAKTEETKQQQDEQNNTNNYKEKTN